MKNVDLVNSGIAKSLLLFSIPLMLANLLQTFYNLADSMIVGNLIGPGALAAVGSSYSLMTFLTSIMIGLCLGSATAFSYHYGAGRLHRLRRCLATSFALMAAITVAIMVALFSCLDWILSVLSVPADVRPMMREYLWIVFWGLPAVFLCNFHSSALRSVGNSASPLLFMGVSCVLNIVLDVLFVLFFSMGVPGAAWATVASQYFSAVMLGICAKRHPELSFSYGDICLDRDLLGELAGLSLFTAAQQSVMNFGILLVQGLVNSFGSAVMAAFSAAVKIDGLAYLPMQDYGNAFSVFISQNRGADRPDRVSKGIRISFLAVSVAGLAVSLTVVVFSSFLMGLFVPASSGAGIVRIGSGYLLMEGSFYILIGYLFLFYGYFRASGRPGVSLLLTVVSLGSRVMLAYILSSLPFLGVSGIWISIPIGWALADVTALVLLLHGPLKRRVH